MLKNKPLVTVIILSYNNKEYLFESLSSLLKQDYSNYELILADDASKDFDQERISNFIEKYKTRNLKKYIIFSSKKNLGTVKNLNKAIRMATGDYVIFFAGDDAFYDRGVISKFISYFSTLPSNAQIVTAQLAMYDVSLKKIIKLFVSEKDIELIKNSSPIELFKEMTNKCIFAAASTCYKKGVFDQYKIFDERYRLVEDWSSALKLSRLEVKYHYVDFIAFKHRHGGISHGNLSGGKKVSAYYDLDMVNIIKHEILPYIKLFNKKQKREILKFYKFRKTMYNYDHNLSDKDKKTKKAFFRDNFKTILLVMIYEIRRYLIDQLSGRKLKLILFGLLLMLLKVHRWLSVFGLILIILMTALIIFRVSLIIYSKLHVLFN